MSIGTPAWFWDPFPRNIMCIHSFLVGLCLCLSSVFLKGTKELCLFFNQIFQSMSFNWIINIIYIQYYKESYALNIFKCLLIY